MIELDFDAQLGSTDLSYSLHVPDGVCALIGPNGSGKSALLSFLLGARRPRSGRIAIGGRTLFDHDAGVHIPIEARRIGFVPQGFGLFPSMSCEDNVAFGMAEISAAGLLARASGRRQLRQQARSLMADLGIEELAARRPDQLSGGQRQRVSLARAIASTPRLLLLDEPMSALDIRVRPAVREFLSEWFGRTGIPALIVTHELDDVMHLATRVAILDECKVAQLGSVESVSADPATEFGKAFFRRN